MRRRTAAAVALAAALVALAFLRTCGGGGDPRLLDGPGSDGQFYSVAMFAAPGEAMTVGYQITLSEHARATSEITLKSVRLVPSHGLELVGVSISGPERQFGVVGTRAGFPPPEARDDPLRLPGAAVPGGGADRERGLAVLIGVRRMAAGRGYAEGLEVVYVADGQQRRQVFRTGLAICAIPGYTRGGADPGACETVPEPEA